MRPVENEVGAGPVAGPEDVEHIRPSQPVVDLDTRSPVNPFTIGIGRRFHSRDRRGDHKQIERTRPFIAPALILAVDHHQVVRSRTHRLVLVLVIPEIAQVRQQLVAVLPVIQPQTVKMVMHAVIGRIQEQ